jgi:tripartite-type tricarboxylate transporter receptor subunit TctC
MAVVACSFLAISILLAFDTSSRAETYPSKPVRLIVPVAAGGATDILARLMAQKLGEELSTNIVVENRPGAGGNVGSIAVARATPDGYTLLFGHNGIFCINSHLYKDLAYDPATDFVPVAPFAEAAYVLLVSKNVPANSVDELIAYAKANPGKLNAGSNGIGSVQKFAGELFASIADIKIAQIHYNSPPTAEKDLLAGTIQIYFNNILPGTALLKSGNVKGLAVTSATRSSVLPDLPTIAEHKGFESYAVTGWFGLFAPKGTPQPIVDRLADAAAKMAAKDELKDRMSSLAVHLISKTPQQYAAFIKDDAARWSRLLKEGAVSLR